jgi:hypothetical protein
MKRKTNAKLFGHDVWTDDTLEKDMLYFQNPPKTTRETLADLFRPIVVMSEYDFEEHRKLDET